MFRPLVRFAEYSKYALAASTLSAAAALLAAGCSGDEPIPTPKVEIREEGGTTPITLSNLGSVAVTKSVTRTFRIINTGDAGAKLKLGKELADLKVSAPYYLLDPTTETCKDGQELGALTGSCTVSLQFVPVTAGTFNSTLEISYSDLIGIEPAAPLLPTSTLLKSAITLTGTGVLDCSVNAELAAKRDQGVQVAQAQMAQDAIQGKKDGEALTEQDGINDGYATAYNVGYNNGYNGPEGYKKGYPIGYGRGLTRGQNDTASCNRGAQDGATNGRADGYAKGRSQGYNDGYANGLAVGKNKGYPDGSFDGLAVGKIEGFNAGKATGAADGYDDGYAVGDVNGYDDGYNDGYFDGETDCNAAKPLAGGVKPKAITPAQPDLGALGGACYNQGYQATYSRAAYNNAYAAAKAANVAYQTGYRNGYNDGLAKGTAAGIAKGYSDGVSVGDRDGFADGSQQRYNGCYNAQYPTSYNAGYTQGYNERYTVGSSDGYTDGYNTSYNSGYRDGRANGYAQTYNSGYNTTYRAAYADGEADGYDNGYDDGYLDGYDDGQVDCGNGAKALGAKSSKHARKPVAKSKVKERAMRGTPAAVKALIQDKKALVSHYAPEAYAEMPAPKSVTQAWGADILNTDALREALGKQSAEARINAILTQQFKKLQHKH